MPTPPAYALHDLCPPLLTPQEMGIWDRLAIKKYGLRPEMLMENAARAATDVLMATINVKNVSIFIFAGPGNNGGDGFAMARKLLAAGAQPLVLHTKPKKMYRGEARYHLELARRVGVQTKYLPQCKLAELPQPKIIIDALLGTGFSGSLRPDMLKLVRFINTQKVFTLAVDSPTGLDGLSGEPCPEAVKAHITATMHAYKLGLTLPQAAQYTGTLKVCEIGIPAQLMHEHPASHKLINADILQARPCPDPHMHKGTAGHTCIIGGSLGMTGAPHLAALGALRAGAGLVTIACPNNVSKHMQYACPEIMTLPLGISKEQTWAASFANEIISKQNSFDSIVLGPGMGRNPQTTEFLAALLPHLTVSCVIDADALYHLALMPERTPKNAILTPHPGEMAHLLRETKNAVQKQRFIAAEKLVQKTKAITVLKGAGTLIALPDGTKLLCPLAAPNLAVAGSGDVLSGLLGALLAAGLEANIAACLGVYIHGIAGKMLAEEYPQRGNTASQIANIFPKIASKQTYSR